ncbi:MFS family permease [Spinactinospora alkalitolerans]|uniref:MFS family permease n=1 Tax=Spinactinospora alkalitolerans TaxID=687207 RepID=A0A852U1Y1_9ACTN|nr:MFS transporter [Spinactinospora alkalitolerans]NYE47990.1 MFS family permease [Spinactinospora alkalitolerans]
MTDTAQSAPGQRAKRRRALGGAMFGFFVDMYDIYLPVIALTPAMAYFTATGSSDVDVAVFSALIFVASIVGRPLGSLIFGPMGDRLGRRRTTLIAAGGSAVCTGIMTVMPGFHTIGVAALVLLVVLRLLDGVFLGGEYTAANPLAMEYAPRNRRGVFGSLINMGYPAALGFITIVTMLTLALFPTGGPDAPYSVWGWRVPFAVGFVFCVALFVLYWRSVPESELWTEVPEAGNPLKVLFSGRNLASFGVAFIVGSGCWLTLNGTVGVFSSHFGGLGVDVSRINLIILVSAAIGMVLFPFVGHLGQRFGRRQVIMVLGGVNLVVGPVALGLAVSQSDALAVIPFTVVAIIGGLFVWAMITAFLMELFPTEVRASGYGIAYSLPSMIPAFYAYYMVWLGDVMPYDYTPVVVLAAGGALLLVGGYLAKDRRHMELAEV